MQREGRLRAAWCPDVRYLLIIQPPMPKACLNSREDFPAHRPIVKQGALGAAELPSRYLPSAATQRRRQAALPIVPRCAAMLDEAAKICHSAPACSIPSRRC